MMPEYFGLLRLLARGSVLFSAAQYRERSRFGSHRMFGPRYDQLSPNTFFIRAAMSANSFSPPPPTSLVAQPS